MKKTQLDDAIKARASQRYEETLEAAYNLVSNNPILNNLRITVEGSQVGIRSMLQHNADSNINEVKEQVVERFGREETKNVLQKLDSINYLLERGQ